nr:hypothetical protein [Klebsiella oxytoca]
MNNEIERIAQHNDMSVEFVTWFFNEKKSACGEHWFLVLGAMWEGWKGRSIEMDRLAAENVALKAFGDKLNEMHNVLNGEGTGIQGRAEVACQQVALEAAMEEFDAIETPAIDRIVAGIKADGVEEFAAYCGEENSVFVEAKAYYRSLPDAAYEFCSMLREGAK